MKQTALSRLPLILLLATASCDDDPVPGGNEEETITTVTITLTPEGGGGEIVVTWDDPDGEDALPATVTPDPLVLQSGVTYSALVAFENGLETPAEDITEEVLDESDEHQLFFTGTAVDGPANNNPGAPLLHAYQDMDVNGLPVGVASSLATGAPGAGELTVTLRHLPAVNEIPVKTADLAGEAAADGLATLPGDTDVVADFNVVVQ